MLSATLIIAMIPTLQHQIAADAILWPDFHLQQHDKHTFRPRDANQRLPPPSSIYIDAIMYLGDS